MKFITKILLLLTLTLPAFAWQEGVEYKTLEKPIGNEKSALYEIFSYACAFCYKYENIVSKILKDTKDIKYIPFHLRQNGDLGETVGNILAVSIAMDNKNNIDILDKNSSFSKTKSAFFDSYFVKKERFSKSESQKYYDLAYKILNIDENEFNKIKNTQQAQNIINNWEKSYEVAKIKGTPAFVVNGKYLIYLKKIKSLKEMEDIINYLKNK